MNIKIPDFSIPYQCDTLVRIGGGNDGSYLVDKNSIISSDILISFGVGITFDFEKSFLKIKKVPIVAFDGSAGFQSQLKKIKFRILNIIRYRKIDYFFESFEHFVKPFKFYFFYKNFRSKNLNTGYRRFVKKFIGNDENSLTLNKVVEKFVISNNFKQAFFQIDIEGGEYELLSDLIDNQIIMSGLVVEFHDFDKNKNLVENFIKNFELNLIHTHVNNIGGLSEESTPKVIEMTFSKHKPTKKVLSLPHPLDKPNSNDFFDYEIIL